MNSELEKIRDAWEKRPMRGQRSSTSDPDPSGDDKVRKMADAYVESHEKEFDGIRDKSAEELVKAVDVFRSAGMEDEQWRIEVWMLHKFEPQNIGGAATIRVRVPNAS